MYECVYVCLYEIECVCKKNSNKLLLAYSQSRGRKKPLSNGGHMSGRGKLHEKISDFGMDGVPIVSQFKILLQERRATS